jgi:PIN domain nuclease of toxin-antitoxin system
MRLLLDTHAVLWMIADDSRLPESARRLILTVDDVVWSTASLWEIGIKLSLNRADFRLGPGWERLIPAEMTRNRIQRLDLEPAHCAAVSKLPWHHRDPFDRLLVAQAQCEKRRLLSCDPTFDGYGLDRAW